MIALYEKHEDSFSITVEDEIRLHPAWLGRISGLKAEKMLRGKNPYLFVIREGENDSDYYITFVGADGVVRHQPFIITIKSEGWCLEQGVGLGPYINTRIEDIIHLIIHCEENECVPFIQNQ